MANTQQEVLQRLIDEIEGSEHIEVISGSYELGGHDPKKVEKRVEVLTSYLGHTLPEGAEDILLLPDPTSLFWKVRGDHDPELLGEFHLVNIITAVSMDTARVSVYNEDLPDETKRLMRQARYFDAQPSLGWTSATVIVLDKDRPFPDLRYLDEAHVYPLDLSIEDYLSTLAVTKGMYYWQYLYCGREAYQDTSLYKKEYVRAMLDVLPDLFPERDYGALRERYAEASG